MRFPTILPALIFLLTLTSQVFAQMNIESIQLPGEIQKITANWTSDGSGNASGEIEIYGIILRVVTNPGSPAPTNGYHATCPDTDNVDLFASQGLSRHTTTSENFCPGLKFSNGTTESLMPMTHYGLATLTVAGAGAAKQGSISVYVKKAKPTN